MSLTCRVSRLGSGLVRGEKTLLAGDLFVTGETPADKATLIKPLGIRVEEKFFRFDIVVERRTSAVGQSKVIFHLVDVFSIT